MTMHSKVCMQLGAADNEFHIHMLYVISCSSDVPCIYVCMQGTSEWAYCSCIATYFSAPYSSIL